MANLKSVLLKEEVKNYYDSHQNIQNEFRDSKEQ